jgi:hypothetical protein
MAKSDNTPATDKPKRKAPRTAWKPGQSGNPKGAPKDGESWAAIIKEISEMSADELFELVGKTNGKINDLGRAYKQMPPEVAMKKLVVARILAALMFEPSGSLWKELMDRTEGKVKDQIEHSGQVTWAEFIKGKQPDADGS